MSNLSKYGAVQRWARELAASDDPGDACVIWPYSRTDGGYGLLWYGARGKNVTAHRVIWELVYGPIPPGQQVRHSCGNGKDGCVNWKHLELGSHAQNMADRARHGRDRRGSEHGRAKLSEADALDILTKRRAGVSSAILAARYGITRVTVNAINRGDAWAHLQQ